MQMPPIYNASGMRCLLPHYIYHTYALSATHSSRHRPILLPPRLLQVLVPELVDNVPFNVGKDDLEYVRVPCYGSALDAFFDVL
jgi:hypothetical protein